MAIPGFCAEMSLFKSKKMYLVSGITSSQDSQVIPQMRISCLIEALGLYGECLGTPLGDRICNIDLSQDFDACRYFS
jgi:hypothetical protein